MRAVHCSRRRATGWETSDPYSKYLTTSRRELTCHGPDRDQTWMAQKHQWEQSTGWNAVPHLSDFLNWTSQPFIASVQVDDDSCSLESFLLIIHESSVQFSWFSYKLHIQKLSLCFFAVLQTKDRSLTVPIVDLNKLLSGPDHCYKTNKCIPLDCVSGNKIGITMLNQE